MVRKIFSLFILSILCSLGVTGGTTFYRNTKKQLITDQSYHLKIFLIKSNFEECLKECMFTKNCQSFNVYDFQSINNMFCDLLSSYEGHFIDNKAAVHFSIVPFSKNVNSTFKYSDQLLSTVEIPSNQKFKISKNGGCLAYIQKHKKLIWVNSPNGGKIIRMDISGRLKIWDTDSYRCIQKFYNNRSIEINIDFNKCPIFTVKELHGCYQFQIDGENCIGYKENNEAVFVHCSDGASFLWMLIHKSRN